MEEPSKRTVAESIASEIKEALGDRVAEIRLYGSVARGGSDEDSDIDLLLVVDRKADLSPLSRILGEWMARSGYVVHLVTLTRDELDDVERRETSFSRAIQREGEALA